MLQNGKINTTNCCITFLIDIELRNHSRIIRSRSTVLVQPPSRITTEIYKKIFFFRFRFCVDSGDPRGIPNSFVWLVRALRIPRVIVRLELAPEIHRFQCMQHRGEPIYKRRSCKAPMNEFYELERQGGFEGASAASVRFFHPEALRVSSPVQIDVSAALVRV